MFKNPPISYASTKPAPKKPSLMRREGAKPSHGMAARHEALFLRLTALHKDVTALATRRGRGELPETVRIVAESLIAECAPYRDTRDRLPVAAPDLAGLCVQLGQVLAQLADYEHRHTLWDAAEACWVWQLADTTVPVRRLKPRSKMSAAEPRNDDLREKLGRMILVRRNQAYELGFEAGRAARIGPPVPPGFVEPDSIAENNPRLRGLD